MSIEIIEGATAAAFGAAHEAIAAKVTQKLPGNLSMAFGAELAGVGVGLFGKSIGLGREISDPIGFAALAYLGGRAAKLAMAGKLMQPGQWGVGGEAGELGGDFSLGGGAPVVVPSRLYGGPRTAPGVRMLGRGGSFALYPSTSEQAGIAG